MANTKTTNLTCGKCSQSKSPDEFYKCSRRKTLKQANCKECSKKTNKEFRNNNPDYYWGTDLSYFKRNYARTMKYHSDYHYNLVLARVRTCTHCIHLMMIEVIIVKYPYI